MHIRQCMRGNSCAGTLIEPLSGRQHQSYLQVGKTAISKSSKLVCFIVLCGAS